MVLSYLKLDKTDLKTWQAKSFVCLLVFPYITSPVSVSKIAHAATTSFIEGYCYTRKQAYTDVFLQDLLPERYDRIQKSSVASKASE